MSNNRRKPASFRVEEVEIVTPPPSAPPPGQALSEPPAKVPGLPELRKGIAWGSLFLAAATGLVGIAAAIWFDALIKDLLARDDWIGWAAIGLLGIVLFALLMIVLREVAGLLRLRRLGLLRHEADSAMRQDDKKLAVDVTHRLKQLYHRRQDMAWGLQRLSEHENDIMNASELMLLDERTLVAPLDAPARAIVADAAKRVSVVTAVSPAALVDMMFVAAENLRMLRKLATLYGARPGTLSLMRLARMVISHIVLTGGIALGDDVIQQVIGHGLTARLSARLGEGVFNGALTTRIGIAAIDVCRPLPYIEAKRPRFRELVAEVAGLS
ncbi:TIGR01620 family protein [Methyloligella sp. 2.7D]|uniref:YcjF family protein n=1 Tax=unclassified Methyloligella TaxID=2625955 RepID=UPI00157D196A|nr:TIGR01620 family protein [Methyloligella sp. GL2]QKP77870.1 TIGR01620 family protein [Methyloligella sp. GL2]